MTHPFYRLGRAAAPHLAKAKWLFEAATGDEAAKLEAEHRAGLHLARAWRGQAPRDDDPATVRLLEDLQGRLTACLRNKRRRFAYEGSLVPETNALALPGGFVFISRPLLELCKYREPEVGFVLAHETAHVVLEHTFKRYMIATAAGVARRAAVARSPVVQVAGTLAQQLVDRGYSRRHEFEADRFAFRLCEAAGIDPAGGEALLGRLRPLAADPEGLGRYFATHPPLDERIRRLRELQ